MDSFERILLTMRMTEILYKEKERWCCRQQNMIHSVSWHSHGYMLLLRLNVPDTALTYLVYYRDP